MKILIVTDIDNPGLKEDCFIAKAFVRDGHQISITRWDYDENFDTLFDVVLLRNLWHLDEDEFSDYKFKFLKLKQRLKKKKIPTINLFSKFDDGGKQYLVELYREGYPVIPTSFSVLDFRDYDENEMFLLKSLIGYDGYGIVEKMKKEIKDDKDFVIQPKIEFVKEIEFYFINKEFQYVLEFVPGKKPIYPIPSLYNYTYDELKIAQQFANLCDDKFVGVQRIDFLKTKDDKLLLLEIGDSAPYLNLNSLDMDTRNKFLNNYKDMVYNYIERN